MFELQVCCDDKVPPHISDVWGHWEIELLVFEQRHIIWYYFSKEAKFSLFTCRFLSMPKKKPKWEFLLWWRLIWEGVCCTYCCQVKVDPIHNPMIPRLELHGSQILAQLLYQSQKILLFLTLVTIFGQTAQMYWIDWLGAHVKSRHTAGNYVSCIV